MSGGDQEGSMRDGFTQRVEVTERDGDFDEFMDTWLFQQFMPQTRLPLLNE